MSWNDGADQNWKDDDTGGFNADNDFTTDTGVAAAETSGDGGFSGGDAGRGGNDTCRNCGAEGHFSRECPEPKQMSGECYNCGQTGHNKADCTNERVQRAFTGTCRICEKEGHRASDCPDKPAETCRICGKEGHKALICEENRIDVFGTDCPDMTDDEAWEAMKQADADKDINDFKLALLAYCKAIYLAGGEAAVDLAAIESTFRQENRNVYLIAKERTDLPDTFIIISLGGKLNQKYVLTLSYTPKARRGKFAEGWPATAEENLERLSSVGLPCDRKVPKCDKCGELGHIKKHCKAEVENDRPRIEVKCVVCDEVGHRGRDCTKERVDRFACRNCKKSGHTASECTEPKDASNVECKRCSQMGHFSRDCPDAPPPMTCRRCGEEGHKAADCEKPETCRNCNQEGHHSRDCTEPKNPANVTCRNCDTMGHFSRDCPKPRDYSRVTCKRCGENGHTVVRCTQPEDTQELVVIDTGNGNGDFDGGAPVDGSAAWATSVGDAAGPAASGGW